MPKLELLVKQTNSFAQGAVNYQHKEKGAEYLGQRLFDCCVGTTSVMASASVQMRAVPQFPELSMGRRNNT